MTQYVVYGLTDPRTGALKYIGRTNNIAMRLSQHRSKPSSRKLREWFRELSEESTSPGATILAVCDNNKEAALLEWKLVRKDEDYRLLNVFARQAGPFIPKPHVRRGAPVPVTGIRFPPEDLALLDAIAALEECDRSDVVRRAIRAYAESRGVTVKKTRKGATK